jgi:hypothetical protein
MSNPPNPPNPFEIRRAHIIRQKEQETQEQKEEKEKLIKSITTNITKIEDKNSDILDFELNHDLLLHFRQKLHGVRLTEITSKIAKELLLSKNEYELNNINLTTYLIRLREIERRLVMLKEKISKNHPLCITFKNIFDESKLMIRILITQMFDSIGKDFDYTDLESLKYLASEDIYIILGDAVDVYNYQLYRVITFYLDPNANEESEDQLKELILGAFDRKLAAVKTVLIYPEPTGGPTSSSYDNYDYKHLGGVKRRRSKFPSYKYYLKAFKTYSKRKLKTFRKRRNYKKTKRSK